MKVSRRVLFITANRLTAISTQRYDLGILLKD